MSDETRITIGDEYEILDVLGHGGMARVFKARHRYLDRLVALKMLPPHFLEDDEARARFEREARAGAQLEHPHIVTTYDFGIYQDQPYLAVAFIEGESLAQYIRRKGRLQPEETAYLVAPIAEALAHAHQKGVIHRDVKSSNIMIRADDERPVLIDFGIAQASSAAQRLTQKGSMLGTPAYMSPEQASAYDIDYRSDLYSLGVVLYECLTGDVPFQSTNTAVLLANIKHEPHRPVQTQAPNVPAWLSAIVDRCLEKKPDDRFPDGVALAEALRTGPDADVLIAEQPLDEQDETLLITPENDPRPAKASPAPASPRSGLLWAAVVVVAMLGLGGIGYLAGLFGGGQSPEPPEIARADTTQTSGPPTSTDSPARDNTPVASDDDTPGDASNPDTPTRPSTSSSTSSSSGKTTTPEDNAVADLMARARRAREAGRYDEALPLLEEAAQRGAADAGFYLGQMYKSGRGARQSDAEAATWYRHAADRGSAEAQFELSLLYRDGRGVERNLDEAVAWCRRAAEGGLAEAQFTLARLYYRGQGVPQNDAEAIAWYRKAADQGHELAQGALERLTRE